MAASESQKLLVPSFTDSSEVFCSCLQTHQKRTSDPITDGCELPCSCWELNSGPLEEQSVLLTTEPSLQPEISNFISQPAECCNYREIGTIIRSLGCSPTEGELHDFIAEVEEEEPTGYIRFEKFIPVMTTVLLEKRYRPIAEDVLLRAFEVLDPTKRGFLTKDELVKYMTEEGVLFPWRLPLELELHGEPFSQEEMEEMLSAAIDPESNTINYRDYITMMVIDEN
ncbi:dynein regulatory complex protein 8 isoform X2 [Rattus norvegicus]|uniref:EF-hand calcium binding domain 2 n=2 Tax=Rattus norvegicus TaxID=10116 RepID=A0A8I5ZXW0_RAT